MIKLFFCLVGIQSVFSAPVIPFLVYGPPQEGSEISVSPFAEKNVEVSRENGELSAGSMNFESKSQLAMNLPGTRNHDEKSIPDSITRNIGGENSDSFINLPGTRNLDEKSIPDSITRNIGKENSDLFMNLPGTKNLDEKSIPDSITLRKIPTISNDLELPRYGYDGRFRSPEVIRGNEELKVENEAEKEKGKKELTLENQPPLITLYPSELEGSEILGTELEPSSNAPSNSFGLPSSPLPSPESISTGPNQQPTVIESVPSSSSEDQINIPPGTSVQIQDVKGQYSHGFSSLDGTQIQESGRLITTNGGWEYVIAKEGSYQYFSPEGLPINVRYVADHNGFRILSQNIGR